MISFDCEGKWGMIDENKSWIENLSDKNLYEIYEFILEVLEKNNLKATFGFVGALLESEEEFRSKIKDVEKKGNHRIWLEKFFRKYERGSEGYFIPELKFMFKDCRHELATHGYCHIPFDRLSEDEAFNELKLIQSHMLSSGISYSSLIYPRNRVAHSSILKIFGLERYRDFPNHLELKYLPKKINSILENLIIFKKAEGTHKNCVPGGIMIHWFYGYRKLIPMSILSKKYEYLLNDAINKNKVAHLWLHPHNLITSKKTKEIFVDLCKKIGDIKKEGKLVDVTFKELEQAENAIIV